MKHYFTAAFLAGGLLAVSGPALADQVSDVMTVYDPTGAIFAQVFDTENGAESVGGFVYLNVAGDPNQFGFYTTFVEPDGSFSDAFGVAISNPDGQPFSLGFYSDTETSGVAAGGGATYFVPEPAGPYNITFYLDPVLQAQGYTATFQSDADSVPEPLTLSLFGAGLLGLGALRRRKAHKIA